MLLWAVAALAVSVSCTREVYLTERASSATGPSALGTRLSVQAVPSSLPRDGTSQSTIVIEAVGGDGLPARLVVLRAEVLVNGAVLDLGTLSSRAAVTGDDGKTRLTYTAPPPAADASGASVTVAIRITASGGELRADVSRQVEIALLAPDSRAAGGAPVPAFVVSPALIVTRATATFDAGGTTDDGVRCGSACNFAWSFGDSSTGSGETVTHAYSAAGSYVVTLTVADAGGASATTSRTVSVQALARPTADFSFSPVSPTAGQDIFFTAEKATAAAGRRLVSYDWDFGSGRLGTGLTIVKRYDTPASYVVTLTVTDDAGEQGVTDRTVTVVPTPAPTASMSFSPTTPNTSTTVFFDASASAAPAGARITAYTFNFGDGTGVGPIASPTTTHTFAATGTYVVRLTVTDSAGRSGTTTVSVPVIAASPTAVLTASPQDPRAGTTVFFDASASSAPSPATITSYAFNFGDGTGAGPSASPSTTHVFASASTYVVRLTVTDSLGRSGTTTTNVTVRSP